MVVAPRLVVVGPSAVGDGGLRVKAQASLIGVGAQCSSNLGPAVAVGARVVQHDTDVAVDRNKLVDVTVA